MMMDEGYCDPFADILDLDLLTFAAYAPRVADLCIALTRGNGMCLVIDNDGLCR